MSSLMLLGMAVVGFLIFAWVSMMILQSIAIGLFLWILVLGVLSFVAFEDNKGETSTTQVPSYQLPDEERTPTSDTTRGERPRVRPEQPIATPGPITEPAKEPMNGGVEPFVGELEEEPLDNPVAAQEEDVWSPSSSPAATAGIEGPVGPVKRPTARRPPTRLCGELSFAQYRACRNRNACPCPAR